MPSLADFLSGFNQNFAQGISLGNTLRNSQANRESNQIRNQLLKEQVETNRFNRELKVKEQEFNLNFSQQLQGILQPANQEFAEDNQTLDSVIAGTSSLAQLSGNKEAFNASFTAYKPQLEETFGPNGVTTFKSLFSNPKTAEQNAAAIEKLISENPNITTAQLQEIFNDPQQLAGALKSVTDSVGEKADPGKVRQAKLVKTVNKKRQTLEKLNALLPTARTEESQKRVQTAIESIEKSIEFDFELFEKSKPDTQKLSPGDVLYDTETGAKIFEVPKSPNFKISDPFYDPASNRTVSTVIDKNNPTQVKLLTIAEGPLAKVSVQSADVEGINPTPNKLFDTQQKAVAAVTTAQNLVLDIGDSIDIIAIDPNVTRVGEAALTVQNAIETVKGFKNITFGEKNEELDPVEQLENIGLLNADGSATDRLKSIAGNNAQLQSITISTAYQIARLDDNQGRISDADLNNALRQLAGDVNDPIARQQVLARAAERRLRRTINKVRNEMVDSGNSNLKARGEELIETLKETRQNFINKLDKTVSSGLFSVREEKKDSNKRVQEIDTQLEKIAKRKQELLNKASQ